jgi:hypothetical protein
MDFPFSLFLISLLKKNRREKEEWIEMASVGREGERSVREALNLGGCQTCVALKIAVELTFRQHKGEFRPKSELWENCRISMQVCGFGGQLPRQTTWSDPASQIAIRYLTQSEFMIQALIHRHPVRDIHRMPRKNEQSPTRDDKSVKKFPIMYRFWAVDVRRAYQLVRSMSTHGIGFCL